MTNLFIGLMSGTSMDAVDAALVNFTAASIPNLIFRHSLPMPHSLRQELLAVAQPGDNELDRVMRLDVKITRLFARLVGELLENAGLTSDRIQAIGSHGQTIRHVPTGTEPYTVQIGNPSLLAELTGITTVADFRQRDMAAGGQGAPLAPAFHATFFRTTAEERVILNIGGIGNITILPSDPAVPVSGFDTGPGNILMDAWAARHLGTPMDENGAWAGSGRLLPELLAAGLADPYFQLPPPKSTGREYFNSDWLHTKLTLLPPCAPQDVQATLVELTATAIASAIFHYAPRTYRLLICGGGVHNQALLDCLRIRLPDIVVESTAIHGVDPDFMEAIGFAWLAKRTLEGLPGNLPEVTGASGARVLGGIYPA